MVYEWRLKGWMVFVSTIITYVLTRVHARKRTFSNPSAMFCGHEWDVSKRRVVYNRSAFQLRRLKFQSQGLNFQSAALFFQSLGLKIQFPGFGKPVAATRNPKPGNILLYAPTVRRALDTKNRPQGTVICQARISKPPPYQEKCKFFEKKSMKGLAVSNPCPTFALAKRNKGTRLPLSNALWKTYINRKL